MEEDTKINKFNMIMFRGKLTVSPNTLNNQIHTYFFAHDWQEKYTSLEFKKKEEDNKTKVEEIEQKGKKLFEIEERVLLSQPKRQVEPKGEKPKGEKPKGEKPKGEEPKGEEPQKQKPKKEGQKKEEPKQEGPKVEEPKKEEPKRKGQKKEEPKQEGPKVEEPKIKEPQKEVRKGEEPKIEAPEQNQANIGACIKKEKQEVKQDYSYEKWMELVVNVSHFNRFYVQCYNELQGEDKSKYINTMDFKAFRLFHDWDVWGDSTSYPELKATAIFNASEKQPIKILDGDLHLSTKMGTNKCIIANQDTDSQDMSKLFAFTINLNQQLKLNLKPSICRKIHFRTVDTLPWTPSMGVHWFASGSVEPLHGVIKPDDKIDQNLSLIFNKESKKNFSELRMLQYRYNHPTKVSNVVGYLMNTEDTKKYEFINHNWRIVSVTAKYDNPNPAKSYNNNTNDNTTAEIFLRNIQFGGNRTGVLVDISAAVMDANRTDFLPIYPRYLKIKISYRQNYQQTILVRQFQLKQQQKIKDLFHEMAGIVLIKDAALPMKPIIIELEESVDSKIVGKSQNININFKGTEQEFNLEIKDRFLKSKTKNKPQDLYKYLKIDQNMKVAFIYEDFIEYELYLTQYGEGFDGQIEIQLSSFFNIDHSGLTQFTTNQQYLKTLEKHDQNGNVIPSTIVKPIKERIQNIIKLSKKFKDVFPCYCKVNQLVFQNKLDWIIDRTDSYIEKLFYNNILQYTFPQQEQQKQKQQVKQDQFAKKGQKKNQHKVSGKKQNENNKKEQKFKRRPFELSFSPLSGVSRKKVKFDKGIGRVEIFLNKTLTKWNNPRHPSMESLCLTGKFKIVKEVKETKETKPKENKKKKEEKEKEKDKKEEKEDSSLNFTALFFQNPETYPYNKIDWLNVIGPKLKLMGLMYPAMQNIIDLYNYDGVAMDAMRRAFEIEDQNHSRYMPATREMSPTTHRQIRRWLYNPIYDYKIHSGIQIESIKPQQYFPFDNFQQGKIQLVRLLKGAFKLELTTIPLYLSAMYSMNKDEPATKLMRNVAKDQMKHLFIVSNLLNAIGQIPPFPKTDTDNAKDENVPIFPVDINSLICFHFQEQGNKYWKKLMGKLPIQASIREQLLRFIMIEMPGEAYQIQINPRCVNSQGELYQPKFQCQRKCQEIFCDCPRSIEQERDYRIDLVRRAINAVVLQLTHKGKSFQDEFLTIGMAYEKITNYLWQLNDMNPKLLFNGAKAKQFTYMYLDHMTEIINLRTALEQIRLITEEGEGSSMFTITGQTNKSSHFIKFIEIFTGCELEILSSYGSISDPNQKDRKRSAKFIFTPKPDRFPSFPNYTDLRWSQKDNAEVDQKVQSELERERLSDNLLSTKFPNIYAPRSFLNNYVKILKEFGFIFSTDPAKFDSSKETFEEARLKAMENTIARMRQMSLNATHVVRPNDTFDKDNKDNNGNKGNKEWPNYPKKQPPHMYKSAGPKFNLADSKWIPRPKDSPPK